jgi:hypothetical protein
MAQATVAELTTIAAAANEPKLTPPSRVKPGGVDPLGLRQINFDLMDQVFPGLNNVARHIRPFVVVSWAWRRATHLAEAKGLVRIPVDDLQDFVDRIEVVYTWSQLLRDPEVDLPGRQVLAALVHSDKWSFGGVSWRKRREDRRYSTAFTAPITYGPGLKSMGWVEPHREYPAILVPTSAVEPALDAFEARLLDRLHHPAFSQFGTVEVTREEARGWGDAWALEEPTQPERITAAELLLGCQAPVARRNGCALMLAAAAHSSTRDVSAIRSTMAGAPSNFAPSAELNGAFEAWRRVQVRQLFRLSLEALFYWILLEIESGPRSTGALAEAFLARGPNRPERSTAREWLGTATLEGYSPATLIYHIRQALTHPTYENLISTISDGLAFCLAEAPEHGQVLEREDRLPLSRARREAAALAQNTTRAFLHHVLESWVIAQHVYWSIGRGLADARARGKTILRLRIVMEEGGWSLTPGAVAGSPPLPTADRLQTAVSLAEECRLFV